MAKTKKKSSAKSKKSPVKKRVQRKVKKVAPIPKGYHTITPYLIINGGKKAIAFYQKAFGAKTTFCMEHAEGKIGHAELSLGDSKFMLSDGCPEKGTRHPQELGGSPVSIYLYVKNVDAFIKRAVDAGAKLIRPIENQFYGDRTGGIEDPFGYQWYVATHIEDITPAQAKKRAQKLFAA